VFPKKIRPYLNIYWEGEGEVIRNKLTANLQGEITTEPASYEMLVKRTICKGGQNKKTER